VNTLAPSTARGVTSDVGWDQKNEDYKGARERGQTKDRSWGEGKKAAQPGITLATGRRSRKKETVQSSGAIRFSERGKEARNEKGGGREWDAHRSATLRLVTDKEMDQRGNTKRL